jgi:hypothetical protein
LFGPGDASNARHTIYILGLPDRYKPEGGESDLEGGQSDLQKAKERALQKAEERALQKTEERALQKAEERALQKAEEDARTQEEDERVRKERALQQPSLKLNPTTFSHHLFSVLSAWFRSLN